MWLRGQKCTRNLTPRPNINKKCDPSAKNIREIRPRSQTYTRSLTPRPKTYENFDLAEKFDPAAKNTREIDPATKNTREIRPRGQKYTRNLTPRPNTHEKCDPAAKRTREMWPRGQKYTRKFDPAAIFWGIRRVVLTASVCTYALPLNFGSSVWSSFSWIFGPESLGCGDGDIGIDRSAERLPTRNACDEGYIPFLGFSLCFGGAAFWGQFWPPKLLQPPVAPLSVTRGPLLLLGPVSVPAFGARFHPPWFFPMNLLFGFFAKTYRSIQLISIQFNSDQFNSIQFISIQLNSFQFNSIQFNSDQFNSIHLNSIQFWSIQFISIQFIFYSFQFNSDQFNSDQFNSDLFNSSQVN